MSENDQPSSMPEGLINEINAYHDVMAMHLLGSFVRTGEEAMTELAKGIKMLAHEGYPLSAWWNSFITLGKGDLIQINEGIVRPTERGTRLYKERLRRLNEGLPL